MTWHSLPTLTLTLTLAVAFGCAKIEDDGESTGDELADTSTGTDASTTETDTSGGEELDCAEATSQFVAFIAANNSCGSEDDCVEVGALCYVNNICGGVALNKDHDADARAEAYDQITAACDDEQCGADPCGATVSCVDSTCVLSP